MRRLVVCCDGTWETPAERTNVSLVAEALAQSDEQVVRYFSGVGTDTDPISRVLQGGLGLNDRIREASTTPAGFARWPWRAWPDLALGAVLPAYRRVVRRYTSHSDAPSTRPAATPAGWPSSPRSRTTCAIPTALSTRAPS